MPRSGLNRAVIAVAGCCLTTTLVAAPLELRITGPEGAPMEGLVVYAQPLAGQAMPEPQPEPLQIAQKARRFAPYIGVVQRNQAVNFINQDDITHHIYSVTGANRFSFKIRTGQNHQVIAQAGAAGSETVAMGCNIHDWMSGYLLVVDTPWFTASRADGRASLPLTQAGPYQLTVWHPQLQAADRRVSQRVQLPLDGPLQITLAQPLAVIPEQSGDEDFEFLDEY